MSPTTTTTRVAATILKKRSAKESGNSVSTQDADNHPALVKVESLEKQLEETRERLAVEEAKRKSAETAHEQMELRWKQAEGRSATE